MTINEALRLAHERLAKTFTYPETAWKEAEILLGVILKSERTWLIAHAEQSLVKRQEKSFFALVKRRISHEPLAYIAGSAEFCGHKFIVNKHVLIPRIETEQIVGLAVGACGARPVGGSTPSTPPTMDKAMILDVGTGSGAIAISVKKCLPRATVVASDISARALKIAKQNAARLLAADQQPIFLQGSLLPKTLQEYIISCQPSKLIVLANLPYLPLSDRTVLQKDVVEYEPASALFAEQDGNALILKLMRQLSKFIKKYSLPVQAYFELDPPQAKTLEEKAYQFFPQATVKILKDECGRERFLEIKV